MYVLVLDIIKRLGNHPKYWMSTDSVKRLFIKRLLRGSSLYVFVWASQMIDFVCIEGILDNR